jgi:hypothetical protein
MSEPRRWGTSVAVNMAHGDPRVTIEPIQYQELAVNGTMRWQLTITVHRDLLINNPDIVVVCGHRRWHAIEDTPEGGIDGGQP